MERVAENEYLASLITVNGNIINMSKISVMNWMIQYYKIKAVWREIYAGA